MSPEMVVSKDVGPDGRVCLLLAGVHCGGDSAMAAILRHLGADQLADAAASARLSQLNSDILASAGSGLISVEPLNPRWYQSVRRSEFEARAVELVNECFAGSSFFALADSGVGRLVPFWRGVLEKCGVRAAVVNFYEDPDTFARRLDEGMGVGGNAARALWLGQALDAERSSRGEARAHVTLEALIQQWEEVLDRVQAELGLVWPAWSSRVRKAIVAELLAQADGVRATAAGRKPAADDLGRWGQETQTVLWRWAREGEDERGFARLDELAGLFDEARDFVGVAFDTVVDLGEQLQRQRAETGVLKARVSELQDSIATLQATPPVHADGNLWALRDGAVDEQLARVEARWAEAFRSSRDAQEILAEQNLAFQNAVTQLSEDLTALEEKLGVSEAEVERLKLVEVSRRAETRNALAEASGLRKTLKEGEETLVKLRELIKAREETIEGLRNAALERLDAGRAVARSGRAGKRVFSPANLLAMLTPKSRRKTLLHRARRELVTQSGMFDAKFYASTYPDVVAAGQDLLDHFIRFGGAEGRHPSTAFNSKWYLNEYPDIRSAGLNPLVHFLEHGRDEGRRRRALTENAGGAMEEAAPASAVGQGKTAAAPVPPPDIKAQSNDLEPTWRPREKGWAALLGKTTGQRDQVASLADVGLAGEAGRIALAGKTIALSSDEGQAVRNRLALFCALRPELGAAVTVGGEAIPAPVPHNLVVEPGLAIDLLADGWFDGQLVATLRFAGGFEGVARAFQFADDGALHCVGESALAGTDADLVELRLLNPLNELLVIFCTRDGSLRECMVLPFPSLLRGGVQHGELAVIEAAPGAIASLSDYSGSLVLDLLGWPEGPPEYAISRVLVDMRGASGIEPLFRSDILASLARRFGVAVSALEGSEAPERAQLVATLAVTAAAQVAGRSSEGAALVLPCDMVPSIYSLVCRRGLHDLAVARYAVVDSATLKPRADISLPFRAPLLPELQHRDHPAHAPYVQAGLPVDGESQAELNAPLCPLAVRHHNKLAWQMDPLMPVSPDRDLGQAAGSEGRTVSVIIDVTGYSGATDSCLAGVAHQMVGAAVEVILAGWPGDTALPECSVPVRGMDGRELTRAARFNAAAQLAPGNSLLFLDSSVILSDPRTLAVLVAMASQQGAASAACALVTENEEEDSVRVHSAGYFPTRISLCGEPVFEIDQLDVATAFPAATYPVVANHLKCCLIDADAWVALGGFDARRFPQGGFDLDFGSRAVAAGFANFCTTLVRAATDLVAYGADFPDPLAHRAVRPADWQAMFDNVTVIRELRR